MKKVYSVSEMAQELKIAGACLRLTSEVIEIEVPEGSVPMLLDIEEAVSSIISKFDLANSADAVNAITDYIFEDISNCQEFTSVTAVTAVTAVTDNLEENVNRVYNEETGTATESQDVTEYHNTTDSITTSTENEVSESVEAGQSKEVSTNIIVIDEKGVNEMSEVNVVNEVQETEVTENEVQETEVTEKEVQETEVAEKEVTETSPASEESRAEVVATEAEKETETDVKTDGNTQQPVSDFKLYTKSGKTASQSVSESYTVYASLDRGSHDTFFIPAMVVKDLYSDEMYFALDMSKFDSENFDKPILFPCQLVNKLLSKLDEKSEVFKALNNNSTKEHFLSDLKAKVDKQNTCAKVVGFNTSSDPSDSEIPKYAIKLEDFCCDYLLESKPKVVIPKGYSSFKLYNADGKELSKEAVEEYEADVSCAAVPGPNSVILVRGLHTGKEYAAIDLTKAGGNIKKPILITLADCTNIFSLLKDRSAVLGNVFRKTDRENFIISLNKAFSDLEQHDKAAYFLDFNGVAFKDSTPMFMTSDFANFGSADSDSTSFINLNDFCLDYISRADIKLPLKKVGNKDVFANLYKKVCNVSPRVQAILAIPFASAVLSLLRESNFTFAITGPTTRGKSALASLAMATFTNPADKTYCCTVSDSQLKTKDFIAKAGGFPILLSDLTSFYDKGKKGITTLIHYVDEGMSRSCYRKLGLPETFSTILMLTGENCLYKQYSLADVGTGRRIIEFTLDSDDSYLETELIAEIYETIKDNNGLLMSEFLKTIKSCGEGSAIDTLKDCFNANLKSITKKYSQEDTIVKGTFRHIAVIATATEYLNKMGFDVNVNKVISTLVNNQATMIENYQAPVSHIIRNEASAEKIVAACHEKFCDTFSSCIDKILEYTNHEYIMVTREDWCAIADKFDTCITSMGKLLADNKFIAKSDFSTDKVRFSKSFTPKQLKDVIPLSKSDRFYCIRYDESLVPVKSSDDNEASAQTEASATVTSDSDVSENVNVVQSEVENKEQSTLSVATEAESTTDASVDTPVLTDSDDVSATANVA